MAECVFEGNIVCVEVDEVTLPNGARMQMEAVRHPGGAAVVAVDTSHRVCLLRQYRPVFDDWVWEIPAGKLDEAEAPARAAERELAEEAGIAAARWQSLGRMLASPGVFDEVVHLYLATGLREVADRPDDHEVFECHWLAMDSVLERCRTGDITDAKTVIAVWRASTHLQAR